MFSLIGRFYSCQGRFIPDRATCTGTFYMPLCYCSWPQAGRPLTDTIMTLLQIDVALTCAAVFLLFWLLLSLADVVTLLQHHQSSSCLGLGTHTTFSTKSSDTTSAIDITTTMMHQSPSFRSSKHKTPLASSDTLLLL